MRSSTRAAVALACLITVTVGLAACDNQSHEGHETSSPTVSAPATSPSATASSSPSPTATVIEVDVEIRDGVVHPSPDRRVEVRRGDTVRIVLTSDEADEVHVHGYDLEAAVGAGESATLEFVADQTGSFEVEAHELDPGLLFTLLVR